MTTIFEKVQIFSSLTKTQKSSHGYLGYQTTSYLECSHVRFLGSWFGFSLHSQSGRSKFLERRRFNVDAERFELGCSQQQHNLQKKSPEVIKKVNYNNPPMPIL